MDYLDSAKQFRHHIMLWIGYVLIAVAIVMVALVLLYQAFGFGLGKDRTVIQNGLVFFSSQPSPADIHISGVDKRAQTNTRLIMPSGSYDVRLSRAGYHDWLRTINLEGGDVQHYDYPFLFPKALTSQKSRTFETAPGLLTQSPDQRWLLIQQSASLSDLALYDLENPTEPPHTLALPADLLTKAVTGERWQPVGWADDNKHVLLQHTYDDKHEFILIDRTAVAESRNLNRALGLNPAKLTLNDRKFDRYYVADAAGNVQTVTLEATSPVQQLSRTLAYQTYSDDTILYVTQDGAPSGKVAVKLQTGDETVTVRQLPASTAGYVVDLTKYDDTMYVAVGSGSDSRVYIYRDPAGQLARQPDQPPVPTQVLHVQQPNYLSFSPNAQFIVAEHGNRFGVYDIENESGYNYTTAEPLDAPQTHASWMDGHRLYYVSAGKLLVFDYDYQNRQTLTAASPSYLPAFTPEYNLLYMLAPGAQPAQFDLMQTPLLTPADQ